MTGELINGSWIGTVSFKDVGSAVIAAGVDTQGATASADKTSLYLVPASDGLNIHMYSFERTA